MTPEERLAQLRDQLRAANERLAQATETLAPGSPPYRAVLCAMTLAGAAAHNADRLVVEARLMQD